eukprot:4439313-Prorocentrum_lima.AAC.1
MVWSKKEGGELMFAARVLHAHHGYGQTDLNGPPTANKAPPPVQKLVDSLATALAVSYTHLRAHETRRHL